MDQENWLTGCRGRRLADDFPLSHDLPHGLEIDCSDLRLPIHPMFALRLRVFLEWHRQEGRKVQVVPSDDPTTDKVFRQLQIDPELNVDQAGKDEDTILPVTHLTKAEEVEDIAQQTREILEYQLTDVSSLGQAAFMAVAELCDNAIDHGRNALGAYVAVRRIVEPRRQVSIAIGDLGMGIPEHIRQRYPEWSDDGYAIAHATQPHVDRDGQSSSRYWLLRGLRGGPHEVAARRPNRHSFSQRVLSPAGRSADSESRGVPCFSLQAGYLDRL